MADSSTRNGIEGNVAIIVFLSYFMARYALLPDMCCYIVGASNEGIFLDAIKGVLDDGSFLK